jgi:osmotically-inducible protein OsmY
MHVLACGGYRSARRDRRQRGGRSPERKIEEALKRHAEIEATAIWVTVRERNKVLLERKVGSWDERNAVENAAWFAPGVKSVEDRTIGPFVYDADDDD